MSEVDPYLTRVAAPGSPFEIGLRGGLRQFVNAPADLGTLIEAARIHGPKTFIVEESEDGIGHRLSYDQVFAWRDRLVPLLGIGRGERVAICMRNRAEWLIAFLAVIRAGGIAALLNSRGSPQELVAMIGEVTPSLVLADEERIQLIRQGGYRGRLFDMTGPLAGGEAAVPVPDPSPAQPQDPAAILFTSGTTGRIKGVVLTHRNLVTGLLSVQMSGLMIAQRMADQYGMPIEQLLARMPQQAVLLVYPLFHISGLGAAFLSPMFSGSKVVIMRRWDAREALRLIAEERISMFTGVPTMLWDVLHTAQLDEVDPSSLTNVASGGQALPANLLEAMRAACPQAAMGTGYGMTECAGSVAQAVGEDFVRKPASAGRVLPLVDMRILGPDGKVLSRGETGEIAVRGAMVMQGYWNRPDETAEVLDAQGWLRSGDIGYVDEEGYVFIVDRMKDMVISGGENIYCAEVERALGELPGVTECAAFGIPDERLGEVLVAVVVGNDLSETELIAQVGERLARYKAPARIAFSAAPLPRNAVGKVDKIALRAHWPELIA